MRNFLITLLRLLGMRPRGRVRVILPACTAGGGLLPGVALNNNAALLDVMEGQDQR